MKDLIQFQNVSFSYNQGVEDTEPVAVLHNEIGRASCRERV